MKENKKYYIFLYSQNEYMEDVRSWHDYCEFLPTTDLSKALKLEYPNALYENNIPGNEIEEMIKSMERAGWKNLKVDKVMVSYNRNLVNFI